MINQMSTGFCHCCGKFLHPEQTEVAWIEPNKAVQVCFDCKRLICSDRVGQALESIKK